MVKLILRRVQVLAVMKLIEFVSACGQMSIKLGKAIMFAPYEMIVKAKAWRICVLILSLLSHFILYESKLVLSPVNRMKQRRIACSPLLQRRKIRMTYRV